MTTYMKMQAFSKPFDVSDYKEKRGREFRSGLKTRSVSMNDREEIRRRLAMDSDSEESPFGPGIRLSSGRKSNLTSRMQSGMSLQICFMNESPGDSENQEADERLMVSQEDPGRPHLPRGLQGQMDNQQITYLKHDSSPNNNSFNGPMTRFNYQLTEPLENAPRFSFNKHLDKPSFLFTKLRGFNQNTHNRKDLSAIPKPMEREEFNGYHHRLHAEARLALSQAKEMAKMQMEIERQQRKASPIADLINLPFPYRSGRSRLTRFFLSSLGVAQLQLLVNDLHTQIEGLNEELVQLLLRRDELHMEQDSILVDIEDLTIFLCSKE